MRKLRCIVDLVTLYFLLFWEKSLRLFAHVESKVNKRKREKWLESFTGQSSLGLYYQYKQTQSNLNVSLVVLSVTVVELLVLCVSYIRSMIWWGWFSDYSCYITYMKGVILYNHVGVKLTWVTFYGLQERAINCV